MAIYRAGPLEGADFDRFLSSVKELSIQQGAWHFSFTTISLPLTPSPATQSQSLKPQTSHSSTLSVYSTHSFNIAQVGVLEYLHGHLTKNVRHVRSTRLRLEHPGCPRTLCRRKESVLHKVRSESWLVLEAPQISFVTRLLLHKSQVRPRDFIVDLTGSPPNDRLYIPRST